MGGAAQDRTAPVHWCHAAGRGAGTGRHRTKDSDRRIGARRQTRRTPFRQPAKVRVDGVWCARGLGGRRARRHRGHTVRRHRSSAARGAGSTVEACRRRNAAAAGTIARAGRSIRAPGCPAAFPRVDQCRGTEAGARLPLGQMGGVPSSRSGRAGPAIILGSGAGDRIGGGPARPSWRCTVQYIWPAQTPGRPCC